MEEHHLSLEAVRLERSRRKLDNAEALSKFGANRLEDCKERDLRFTIQPSTNIDITSGSSSASDHEGSLCLLLRSPDSINVNGLYGFTAEQLKPTPAGPRIDLGDSSQALQGVEYNWGFQGPASQMSSAACNEGTEDCRSSANLKGLTSGVNYLSEVSHEAIEVKELLQETHEGKAPLILQFKGLTYTVRKKSSTWCGWNLASKVLSVHRPSWAHDPISLRVLDDVSGSAREGEILAVMGPSGSGKSTLIDALAQRLDSVQGSMTLNGDYCTEHTLRSISAYIMQVRANQPHTHA